MHLTVHLFRPGVDGPRECLRRPDGTTVVAPRAPLPFEAQLVQQVAEPSRPEWLDHLAPYFAVWDGAAETASAVLLVRHAGRWWALTFGPAARHWVREDRVEPDFGLLVAANSLAGATVRGVQTRSSVGVPRRRVTSLARPGAIGAFDIDTTGEWIRALTGAPAGGPISRIDGSGPARVTVAVDLPGLGDVLDGLLERYHAEDYKDAFPHVQDLRPVAVGSPTWVELERRARDAVLRDVPGVVVDLVDDGGDGPAGRYELLLGDGRARSLSELELPRLRQYVGRFGSGFDPLDPRVRIRVVTPDGVGPARPLRQFLTAEDDGRADSFRYVLADGTWYRVDRAHHQAVVDEVRRVELVDLRFPTWAGGETEGEYNERAALETGAVPLDRKLVRTHFDRHGVEACDLLARGTGLVHVKRLERSSTLSHLFAQGVVSARLLYEEPEFRRHVEASAGGRLPDRVVFALGTHRAGDVRDLIPFFSKVFLVTQLRAIRATHREVALARIDVDRHGDVRRLGAPAPVPTARSGTASAPPPEHPAQEALW